MILDTDSIETLPSDAALVAGNAADDDVIFDAAPNVLPGILEEPDEKPLEIEMKAGETLIGSDSSAFATYKPTKDVDLPKPVIIQRQSSTDEKRGVFTKILEFVGVVRKKEELETSVFYDEPVAEAAGVEGIEEILKATDLTTIPDEVMKKRSPSPRIAIPETVVIAATPPTSPDHKPVKCDPVALTVAAGIPETPPVVFAEKKTPIFNTDDLKCEIDGILEKAQMIVEDQLSDCHVYTEPAKTQPPIAYLDEFEEIRVTRDVERLQTGPKPSSSKLSQQILKAIPPPRRRAITDAKTQPAPSEIQQEPPPVPPRRRNRSKQRDQVSSTR